MCLIFKEKHIKPLSHNTATGILFDSKILGLAQLDNGTGVYGISTIFLNSCVIFIWAPHFSDSSPMAIFCVSRQ